MKQNINSFIPLLEAHSKTTLSSASIFGFRSVRQYTHENAQASRHYDEVKNGLKTCMYPGYPIYTCR